MVNRFLLLGAGFSRNWGGPLASEVLPRLLSCPEVDGELRTFILKHESKGFEGILGLLQDEQRSSAAPIQRLVNFEGALVRVFRDLHQAYKGLSFNWSSDINRTVTQFLTRFDAIFTLNQDTLLELHYLNDNVCLMSPDRRWDGWNVPGMQGRPDDEAFWTPAADGPKLHPRLQPYIKLHGSSNWRKAAGGSLLVMGERKQAAIAAEPLFAWSHETFAEFIGRPDTRLMVIGYSFRDPHINEAICKAVSGGNLKLFVIDPSGMDVVDDKREENKRVPIRIPSALSEALKPAIWGASSRPLSTTFGNDIVEHQYVRSFVA